MPKFRESPPTPRRSKFEIISFFRGSIFRKDKEERKKIIHLFPPERNFRKIIKKKRRIGGRRTSADEELEIPASSKKDDVNVNMQSGLQL